MFIILKHLGVPFRLLRPIVRQLLVALEILYNNGIIHCDVKPENILLGKLEDDIFV